MRHINPLGRVDVPSLGRTLEPGEEFDGPEELLEQAANYEPVMKPARKPTKKADA
jgi:hypothetical protein